MSPDYDHAPITPLDLLTKARTTARYLMTIPGPDRHDWLRKLKEINPLFATLVRSAADNLRTDQKGR